MLVKKINSMNEEQQEMSEKKKSTAEVGKEEPVLSPTKEQTSEKDNVNNEELGSEELIFGSSNVKTLFGEVEAKKFINKTNIGRADNVFIDLPVASKQESVLDYQLLSNCNYVNQLSDNEKKFISQAKKIFTEQLYTSRLLVINNTTAVDSLEMALVESIVLDESSTDTFSCVLEHNEIRVSDLISDFGKDAKRLNQKQRNLVVFEKRESRWMINDFLKSITRSGGAGDLLKTKLDNEKLKIIYVCALGGDWLDLAQQKQVYTIDALSLSVFQKKADCMLAMNIALAINSVTYKTGWLAHHTPAMITEIISDHIDAGTIDELIREESKNINVDVERENIVRQLSGDPLKSMILFIACFFEKISLVDFCRVMDVLIKDQCETELGTNGLGVDLRNRWKNEADIIINNCGLLLEYSPKGTLAFYRFEKSKCKELAREIFLNQFRQLLIGRFKILQKSLWLNDFEISDNCIEGVIDLAFINAQTETEGILTEICMNLIDELTTADDYLASKIFSRLLLFIQKWQEHVVYTKSSDHLYRLLKSDRQYRTIFLLLFTKLCTPAYPFNLDKLKILLAAMSRNEIFTDSGSGEGLAMIECVFENYSEEFYEFAKEVSEWVNLKEQSVSQSYAYISSALLIVLQSVKMSKLSKYNLNYKLLKPVLEKKTFKNGLDVLSRFVFSKESKIAYLQLFEEGYTKKKRQVATSDLFLIYAFILIHWYLMIEIIVSDNEIDVDKLIAIKVCLDAVQSIHEPDEILSGLRLAIKKYNMLIIREKNINITGGKVKLYQQKRDAARELLELAETQKF